MCRGRLIHRSTSRVASPNAAWASRRAAAIASPRPSAERTSRMPFPPPPADGLSSTASPEPSPAASAARASSASVSPAASLPGTTGTPAALTMRLAAILSPIAAIAPAAAR